MKLHDGAHVALLEGSLPTRERELKLAPNKIAAPVALSLPTRERELKLLSVLVNKSSNVSLPTRERELKHLRRASHLLKGCRSLHGSVN